MYTKEKYFVAEPNQEGSRYGTLKLIIDEFDLGFPLTMEGKLPGPGNPGFSYRTVTLKQEEMELGEYVPGLPTIYP